MMELSEHAKACETCAEAERQAAKVMELLGFCWDDDVGGFLGNVSLGLSGTTLGKAAAWLMAAVDDHAFEMWVDGVRKARKTAGAEIFSEH